MESNSSSQVAYKDISNHADSAHSHVSNTRQIYKFEVSEAEQSTILSHLEAAVKYFIVRNTPVFLEEFGIVFPRISNPERTYVYGEHLVIRKERIRSIGFEKCSDLTTFHRTKYEGIIETRELAERICATLPIEIGVYLGDRIVRREIKSLIQALKREVTSEGFSSLLRGLGIFYSLHNRQGSSLNDWFAGSDIFLRGEYDEALSVSPCSVYPRPVLDSAWELLEAAYGKAIAQIDIDLTSELAELGYDISQFPADLSKTLKVSVFSSLANDPRGQFLIYSTDGLRSLGHKSTKSKGFGVELIFHLPIKSNLSKQVSSIDSVPKWPTRVFTLGWIMLQCNKSNILKPGTKFSDGTSIVRGFDTDLRVVLATTFSKAKEEHLGNDGPFFFVNLVGVTEDEAKIADKYGSQHLLNILEQRDLLQFTKPTRSSVTDRSSFSPKTTSYANQHILHDPRINIRSSKLAASSVASA